MMPPDAFYAAQMDEYATRVAEQGEEIVRLGNELAAVERENVILRAKVETAASMVKHADPDLAEAMLWRFDEPVAPPLAVEVERLQRELQLCLEERDHRREQQVYVEALRKDAEAERDAESARYDAALDNLKLVRQELEDALDGRDRLGEELDYLHELRAQNDRMAGECAAAGDKITELRAEVEGLKHLLELASQEHAEHRAEVERLRADLKQMDGWHADKACESERLRAALEYVAEDKSCAWQGIACVALGRDTVAGVIRPREVGASDAGTGNRQADAEPGSTAGPGRSTGRGDA